MQFSTLVCSTFFGLFLGKAIASPETAFWRWFDENEPSLFNYESDREHTFNRLAKQMHKVDPNLTFEFGPKQNGVREFVISADGIKASFPKVESLWAAAPALQRWKFIKFRSRRPAMDVEYEGVKVKAATVQVQLVSRHGEAGIVMIIPEYRDELRDKYLAISYLILDQALGEYDVETKVGPITVSRTPVLHDVETLPLDKLPTEFDKYF